MCVCRCGVCVGVCGSGCVDVWVSVSALYGSSTFSYYMQVASIVIVLT